MEPADSTAKQATVSVKVIASRNARVNRGEMIVSEAIVGTCFIAVPVFAFLVSADFIRFAQRRQGERLFAGGMSKRELVF